jgi:hypothetical protein
MARAIQPNNPYDFVGAAGVSFFSPFFKSTSMILHAGSASDRRKSPAAEAPGSPPRVSKPAQRVQV